MAKEETFMLVSLEDQKSKDLARVIGSDSCRKILDLLSKKEATALEISKKLNVPLPTVHYNLQALVKSKLVSSKEFKWSPKGKEMSIYKIAKKVIIIAPEEYKGFKNQIKNIFPVAIFGVVIAAVIQAYYSFSGKVQSVSFESATLDAADTVPKAVEEAVKQATTSSAGSGAGQMLAQEAANVTQPIINVVNVTPTNYGLWFLYGVLFSVLFYLFWRFLIKK